MLSFIPDTPNIAIWAMMVACFLPVVFAGIAKYMGGFTDADNQNSREFLNKLTGMPARADAVQKNSYETLPMFLAAVITAMLFFIPQQFINNIACLYVALRVAFGIAYILNLALFRTILWTLSFLCIMILFWTSSKAFW